MAIEDFVSTKGWKITEVAIDSVLMIDDVLYIAKLQGDALQLVFKRAGAVFLEGPALFTNDVVAGVLEDKHVRLKFAGLRLDISIRYSKPGGGPSPDGGGSSSGPGGN